jgi:hypothetical protein
LLAREVNTVARLDWKFEATDLLHTAPHCESLNKLTFTDVENRVSSALRYTTRSWSASALPRPLPWPARPNASRARH